MRWWNSLLGRTKPAADAGKGLQEHLGYLDTLRLPAIALFKAAKGRRSRLGGLPTLPPDVPWPEWRGKPLAFLCQLDLGEIPLECDRQGLPPAGTLLFFYAQEQDAWGYDPQHRDGWRVVYSSSPPGDAPERAAPLGLDKDCTYKPTPLAMEPIGTYPDCEDARIEALGLSDSQMDDYVRARDGIFGERPQHHLFGYPTPIQTNDMDLECQLTSNGLYCGNASGYRDPRRAALEAGRSDWVLLLQLDTDDEAGMMWGDVGMLYFWIRKQDLAERRFDRCWMILQCH
jgi:uncharacterized protein YwqG